MSFDPQPFHNAAASFRERQAIFVEFVKLLVNTPFISDLVWTQATVDLAAFTYLGREWRLTHSAILSWRDQSVVVCWVRSVDLAAPDQYQRMDGLVMDRFGNVISQDASRATLNFRRDAFAILLHFINAALSR